MSSKKIPYSSFGQSVDGTTFCSGVETLAENIIEDDETDATITVPSKKDWLSVKSVDYRITTENSCIILPQDIYKIRKVYLRAGAFLEISGSVSGGIGPAWYKGDTDEGFFPIPYNIPAEKCYLAASNELWDGCIDITYLVKTAEEFSALEVVSTDNVNGSINKNNTMYYSKGERQIKFGEASQKLFSSSRASIINLILKHNYDFNKRSENAENREFDRKLYTYIKNGHAVDIGEEGTKIYSSDAIEFKIADANLDNLDIRDLLFRIEYIPMFSKTKIRARKNAPTKEEYIQPFNQRAEINAASAFGKNMYLTAQKTGCKEIKLVKNYTRLNDIPPLGALVRHNGKKYRLVANHYDFTNTVYVKVTHTLSENWSEKSKHVAVDQKYRNWTIPQDTLWRNLYWEDYLRVGTSRKRGEDVEGSVPISEIMKCLSISSADDKTVATFAWVTDEDLGKVGDKKVTGATLPCSTMGIANSMIFTAAFKDNISAGLRMTNSTHYLCEDALYCKEDGTLTHAHVILGEGIANYIDVVYPSVLGESNAVDTEVFNTDFYIHKDPGEAIKFTYQIHLIGEDDCVFGNKFAEHNPLIKDWKGKNRKFRVWLLTHYVREGVDVLETTTGDEYRKKDEEWKFFDVEPEEQTSSEYGDVFKLTLKLAISEDLKEPKYKAWAITDENNNLYVACNDASVETLYFQLHHKR